MPSGQHMYTFENILGWPYIRLLFLIPGKKETFRVQVEARLVWDEFLLDSLAYKNRALKFAVVVYVEEAFMHCQRGMIRSKLWEPDARVEHGEIPTILEVAISMETWT